MRMHVWGGARVHHRVCARIDVGGVSFLSLLTDGWCLPNKNDSIKRLIYLANGECAEGGGGHPALHSSG